MLSSKVFIKRGLASLTALPHAGAAGVGILRAHESISGDSSRTWWTQGASFLAASALVLGLSTQDPARADAAQVRLNTTTHMYPVVDRIHVFHLLCFLLRS